MPIHGTKKLFIAISQYRPCLIYTHFIVSKITFSSITQYNSNLILFNFLFYITINLIMVSKVTLSLNWKIKIVSKFTFSIIKNEGVSEGDVK